MSLILLKTSRGDINLELFEAEAPLTTANFKKLILDGFYNGLSFHRVIRDFVIQGGCPNTREGATGMPGTGGPGLKIKCETQNNPHRHSKGALSMAHAGKDTGGSQFFIVNGPASNVGHLDGVHTVFGRCVSPSDIDVVMNIKQGDRILEAQLTNPVN